MADLLATQRDIAAALRDAAHATAATHRLVGDATRNQRRLAIYRGNVAAVITKALAAAYPVAVRVVGEEFFEGLASAFLRECPSTSGDLHDYGAAFAGFVERFPHTRTMPYLPDLARLEWAAHRAYGAADAEPLDQAALARVAPEDQGALCFQWAAGTAVVSSAHPVLRIWTIHQPGYSGEFSVAGAGAEQALVAREGLHVTVSALDAGGAFFIERSLAGASLAQAMEAAFAADPAFDLGGLLGRAIPSGLICAFTIQGENRQ